ncbi:MAG: FAD-binding domain-containing protein [Rhodobacterales bacterium]
MLARHSPQAAEKFVQEVFWRTYWKGWLELRPTVWADYQRDLAAAMNQIQTQAGLRARWEAACLGQTGIDGSDHWARQLADTGYLHNHARMWFASIWIHTLQLPWVLGADFFSRHLLDGDAASNTLSWRWVGGIQTQGKAYLAQPDDIAKYTQDRFRPEGLAQLAAALPCPPHPDRGPLPASATIDPAKRTGLIVTEDRFVAGLVAGQGCAGCDRLCADHRAAQPVAGGPDGDRFRRSRDARLSRPVCGQVGPRQRDQCRCLG